MKNIYEYLKEEEKSIKEEIENVLRKICAGRNYREWSEEMIKKLYGQIRDILVDDLIDKEDAGRLEVTEEMVITAMMMCLN